MEFCSLIQKNKKVLVIFSETIKEELEVFQAASFINTFLKKLSITKKNIVDGRKLFIR
jgi:hypothetical protein